VKKKGKYKKTKIMNTSFLNKLFLAAVTLLIWNCSPKNNQENANLPLPILGNRHVQEFEMEGKTIQDTVYHRIADFSFTNQEGKEINKNSVEGKVYVADFFFTSCPTICPIMKTQMLRVYEKFQDQPDFLILSHTLDPSYDTPEMLKDFASKIGVEDDNTWHFLTGNQEKIFEIGQTSYMTTAMSDQAEPGGYLHSGAFILVDQKGHIRGVYDGTKEDQVNRMMNDIPKLLQK
jgi:protein SCO1